MTNVLVATFFMLRQRKNMLLNLLFGFYHRTTACAALHSSRSCNRSIVHPLARSHAQPARSVSYIIMKYWCKSFVYFHSLIHSFHHFSCCASVFRSNLFTVRLKQTLFDTSCHNQQLWSYEVLLTNQYTRNINSKRSQTLLRNPSYDRKE